MMKGPFVLLSTFVMSVLAFTPHALAADRTGAQVYRDTCAQCHTTGVSPDLGGQQLTLEVIAPIVRNGNNAMPAFRVTEISNGELKALATFLTNLPPAAEVKP